jgi:hypothetical protein
MSTIISMCTYWRSHSPWPACREVQGVRHASGRPKPHSRRKTAPATTPASPGAAHLRRNGQSRQRCRQSFRQRWSGRTSCRRSHRLHRRSSPDRAQSDLHTDQPGCAPCDAHSTFEMGQHRQFAQNRTTSASAQLSDVSDTHWHVAFVPILLQKSFVISTNSDFLALMRFASEASNDGATDSRAEAVLSLEAVVPEDHLDRLCAI